MKYGIVILIQQGEHLVKLKLDFLATAFPRQARAAYMNRIYPRTDTAKNLDNFWLRLIF